jgi:hypothetical protein
MTMPFDTLKLARRLEGAGFSHQQAGDMSDGIAEALSALATKDDLLLTKNDLRHEIEGVRHEIGRVDARVSVVMWAVGVNVAMTIAILGVLLHH